MTSRCTMWIIIHVSILIVVLTFDVDNNWTVRFETLETFDPCSWFLLYALFLSYLTNFFVESCGKEVESYVEKNRRKEKKETLSSSNIATDEIEFSPNNALIRNRRLAGCREAVRSTSSFFSPWDGNTTLRIGCPWTASTCQTDSITVALPKGVDKAIMHITF